MTPTEIAELIRTKVSDRYEATTWVAVVLAESGGDPHAYNLVDHNPNEDSYLSTDNGLFQINSYWHGANIPVHMANRPEPAWDYVYDLASNHNGFEYWNAWKNGAFTEHMDTAGVAVASVWPVEETDVSVWHDREEWQTDSQPVKGPAFPGWDAIPDGIVIHWPGHNNIPTTTTQVIQRLQAEQNDYVTNRGYSLGYNFVIDPLGDIWEVRGFDYRNAANKGSSSWGYNVNHTTISVQVQYAKDGGTVTQNQIDALRVFIATCWEQAGYELDVAPHSDWDATSCCGDPLRLMIEDGTVLPTDQKDIDMRAIRLRHPDYANQFVLSLPTKQQWQDMNAAQWDTHLIENTELATLLFHLGLSVNDLGPHPGPEPELGG